LNDKAGQLAIEFDLHGGTDITGFGFLGHAMEMAETSDVALHFEFGKIPFISGARKYADMGCFAGGAFDNKIHFESKIGFVETIDEQNQMLLYDPQTSGGLLLGVPQSRLDVFQSRAKELDQSVWIVGEVRQGSGIQTGD